jgi:hypothetical protein
MARTIGGEVFEKCPEGDERSQGHLRGLHECEPSTALTQGHPLGNDGPRAIGREGEEDPFAGEGDDLLTIYGERVAIQRVPRIVDGDRA